MSKKEFWIKLVLYVIFGGLIPVVFLIIRFNLFSTVSKLSIGGWGIVCILFACIFVSKILKAVKKGLPFSMATQIITGVCKTIIPLVASAFIVYYMQNCMKEIFQFLVVLIICELIAIIVNPFPKWIHVNKLDEDKQNLKSILESLK